MNSKRKNVASELLQTEREYTNNLQILIQVRKRLKKSKNTRKN